MKNKQLLGALAMDLKRVALGYFKGSTLMANRFLDEALKKRSELDSQSLKPYLLKFLHDIDKLNKEERDRAAEDALFYSTIFQNAALY